MESNRIAREMNEIKRLVKVYAGLLAGARVRNVYKIILDQIEKPVIEAVLDKMEGNQYKAARILGINRNTLHSKIKKLAINVENFKRFY